MAHLLRIPMAMSRKEARVLVIEHQDVLRVMLFTILRQQPLGVDTAATAADALDKVSRCDYALIILDVNLPGEQSILFLDTFRTERPEATSFIIAVRDPNSDIVIPRVDAVVTKPLEIDTLAEVVRECAAVVPPPDDPLPCPPAESEIQDTLDRTSLMSN
jgi:DNA-binding response OmpR family regulator